MSNLFKKQLLDKHGFSADVELWMEESASSNRNAVMRGYINNILSGLLEFLAGTYEAAHQICESPIEKMLFDSLLMSAQSSAFDVYVKINHQLHFIEGDYPASLSIEPQWKLNKYRCDFLISLTQPDFSNTKGPDIVSKCIVECDGHDYHERTKEQARKDKARDRAITASGIPVFRYTGSEIFEDPFRCAKEIIKFLEFGKI